MDWEKWDWFFGPNAVRHPVSDGTEPEPEEENFTFGILTEEDSDRETEDENGIW